jgi:hypothetical protein
MLAPPQHARIKLAIIGKQVGKIDIVASSLA